MKVIIVGGVAGGASCAARLRRLDEKAEILMVERGPYVSYANCGLPYHVGGVIEKESSLLVATRADVPRACSRSMCGPTARRFRSRRRRRPWICAMSQTGEVTTESYDKLVLSPGAPSVHPPLPGIDLPGIFQVQDRAGREDDPRVDRTGHDVPGGDVQVLGIPDGETRAARGGRRRRVHRSRDGGEPGPSRVRRDPDPEARSGPGPARSGDRAPRRGPHEKAWRPRCRSMTAWPDSSRLEGGALEVQTISGKTYPADIVILAIGVRPDTTLAKTAGLEIGERGGIRVDEHMRTSDPDIFAVGDAVEVKDFVTGQWSLVALAGPANRQGRIAADVIAGRDSRYRGTQGTSIIGLFGGGRRLDRRQREDAQEARRQGLREDLPLPEFARRILPGRQDARVEGHLPEIRRTSPRGAGARPGRTGGGQADQRLGHGDPDGRDDLRPGRSRALLRAPVRQRKGSGQLRRNGRRQCPSRRHADQSLGSGTAAFLLDVREPVELAVESVPGAVNIPLGQLRARLGELPRDREIHRHLPLRPSAPTTRRASCCRTDSRPEISPAACFRGPCYALGKLNF